VVFALGAMSFLGGFDWYQLKLFAEHSTGISMDALHMIVGVMLQLLIALLFRSSMSRPMPLLAVLALELVNEANDFRVEIWPDPGMQFGEAVKDVVLTMFIPTLIFLVARRRPKLLVQGSN
jgi:predicted Na+-dependent transporter